MPLYIYIKIPPGKTRLFIAKKKLWLTFKKFSPFLFIPAGLSLVLLLSQQLLAYQFLIFKKAKERIMAPISEIAIAETQGFTNLLVAGASSQDETKSNGKKQLDYNLINNWFPTASLPQIKDSKITHYTLSIPKVRIQKAIVEIGGKEIKDALIQYPGTALPGEFGNVVIFGHSILPVFYNPRDYESIFSLIPTLEKGDQILVDFDGIEFSYEVVSYKEVKPEEINVLEQRFDQQALSLITCVPPGTYLKRGIILARLVRL